MKLEDIILRVQEFKKWREHCKDGNKIKPSYNHQFGLYDKEEMKLKEDYTESNRFLNALSRILSLKTWHTSVVQDEDKISINYIMSFGKPASSLDRNMSTLLDIVSRFTEDQLNQCVKQGLAKDCIEAIKTLQNVPRNTENYNEYNQIKEDANSIMTKFYDFGNSLIECKENTEGFFKEIKNKSFGNFYESTSTLEISQSIKEELILECKSKFEALLSLISQNAFYDLKINDKENIVATFENTIKSPKLVNKDAIFRPIQDIFKVSTVLASISKKNNSKKEIKVDLVKNEESYHSEVSAILAFSDENVKRIIANNTHKNKPNVEINLQTVTKEHNILTKVDMSNKDKISAEEFARSVIVLPKNVGISLYSCQACFSLLEAIGVSTLGNSGLLYPNWECPNFLTEEYILIPSGAKSSFKDSDNNDEEDMGMNIKHMNHLLNASQSWYENKEKYAAASIAQDILNELDKLKLVKGKDGCVLDAKKQNLWKNGSFDDQKLHIEEYIDKNIEEQKDIYKNNIGLSLLDGDRHDMSDIEEEIYIPWENSTLKDYKVSLYGEN